MLTKLTVLMQIKILELKYADFFDEKKCYDFGKREGQMRTIPCKLTSHECEGQLTKLRNISILEDFPSS